MLANIADKFEEGEVLHPVVVIDHLGSIGGIAVEIKEFGKLTLDTFLIMAQSLFIKELAFLTLH